MRALSEPAGEARSPSVELAGARRKARCALAVLWIAYLVASLWFLPEDAVLAVAVLLAGVSTVLESVHGALAFDRLIRRVAF